MKKAKKLMGLALAAAMTMTAMAPVYASAEMENYGADYLEGIKEAGTLVVGCDPTIEGVCYLDPVSS